MSRRTRITLVALAIVAVIAGAVVVSNALVPAPSADDTYIGETPPPTPDPVPVKTPAATADPAGLKPGADASELVIAPLAALDQALGDPSVPVDLSEVADGLALGDLNAEVSDYVRSGLHQEGSFSVVSAKVVTAEPDADRPTAVLNVCIDRSKVKVIDADGNDMTSPTAQDRVLQVWTMAMSKEGWKLTDRTFADDLTC